jgi:hypothetical protein
MGLTPTASSAIAALRGGRPLIYALVDLPTNALGVAACHLREVVSPTADEG